MASPVRLTLLEALRSGPRCVCELVPLLDVEQPAASKHLKMLKDAGLIESHREGQRVIYQITEPSVLRLLDVSQAIVHHRRAGVGRGALQCRRGRS